MTDLDAVFDAVAKLPFVDAQRMGIAGRELRRLRGELDHRPHQPVQGRRHARRRLQPRVDEHGDRGAVVHRVGVRRPAVGREGARAVREVVAAPASRHNIKTPTLIITNELDFRVPVDQGLQMFTALRRNGVPSEDARLPGRGPLGAEGAQQPRPGTRRCSAG